MRSITVREEFSTLKEFTANLPHTFEREGQVIHNGRNIIRKIDTGRETLVVKNFAGMYFFNRLAYSLFRKSKAARSYEHSALLNEKGIKTPPHVSWLDIYSMGLLTRSYFVSVFYPYRTLDDTIKFYGIYEPSWKESLIRDLTHFIRKLHLNSIYHEDLSLGNLLVIRTVDGHDFVLVDLNRIKFRRIGWHDALRNLSTLSLPAEEMNALITMYAQLNGEDGRDAIRFYWSFQKRKFGIRHIRRMIRRYTLTPVESLFKRLKYAKHPEGV